MRPILDMLTLLSVLRDEQLLETFLLLRVVICAKIGSPAMTEDANPRDGKGRRKVCRELITKASAHAHFQAFWDTPPAKPFDDWPEGTLT